MNIHTMGTNPGQTSIFRASEVAAHIRNNAIEASLEVKMATLEEKERKTNRKLQTQTCNILDSIQSVKLGRRKRNKSLPRNHIGSHYSRSRSGSLTSTIPRPRTCLADTLVDNQGGDRKALKLPAIGASSFDKCRVRSRPASSLLQRRRYSENDALVESLRRFNALRIDASDNDPSDQSATDDLDGLPDECLKTVPSRGGQDLALGV